MLTNKQKTSKHFRMDNAAVYQPPSLENLSLKVDVLYDMPIDMLVWPLRDIVSDLKALHGVYTVKASVLEVKRIDGSEPSDQDWEKESNCHPPVKIGSSVKLVFKPRAHLFKAWIEEDSGFPAYPYYDNYFEYDDRRDNSHSCDSETEEELEFLQEMMDKSSVQTIDWSKIVPKHKKNRPQQERPWTFRKESFSRNKTELRWKIQNKTDTISSSWICVCRRAHDQTDPFSLND